MKRALGAVFAAVVMLAGCGSSKTTHADPTTAPAGAISPAGTPRATPSGPLMLPVGRSVVLQLGGGGQARVTVSSIVKQTTPPTKDSSALRPGQAYVVAHVSVQCVALGPCEYSQFGDWYAIDPTGTGSDLEAGGVQPALGSGTLATGHVVSGYVTEDASAQANQLTFGSDSDPQASWAIS
jgi:hypothetical protein